MEHNITHKLRYTYSCY